MPTKQLPNIVLGEPLWNNRAYIVVSLIDNYQTQNIAIEKTQVRQFLESMAGLIEYESEKKRFATLVRSIQVNYSEHGYFDCVFRSMLTMGHETTTHEIDYVTVTPMMNAYLPIRQHVVLDRPTFKRLFDLLVDEYLS